MVEGQLALCEIALLLFNKHDMINFRNINPNETGLSVRSKLNEMLAALISGNEGVNKLWKRLVEVNNSLNDSVLDISDLKEEVQNRIFDTLGYTDREINDILTYINGMYGGVSGFAEDTNFQPDFPEDTAATVIGIGPGTFTYMIGEDGSPITIDSVSIVIFYKGAESTYWKYNTILPTVIQNEVTGEFGDSTSKVITQKFFTDHVKGVAGGTIDISDMAILDTYGDASKSGMYTLTKGSSFAGMLLISGDLDSTIIYQIAFGGFNVVDGSLVSGKRGIVAYRLKNVSSVTSDVDRGIWGAWSLLQDDFMQVLSEDEYNSIRDTGKIIEDRFYFVYEEE